MKGIVAILLIIVMIGSTCIAEAGGYKHKLPRHSRNYFRQDTKHYSGQNIKHYSRQNTRQCDHNGERYFGHDLLPAAIFLGGTAFTAAALGAITAPYYSQPAQPQVIYVQQPAQGYYGEPDYPGPQTRCQKYQSLKKENGVVVEDIIRERCESTKTENTY